MAAGGHGIGHILRALGANFLIAVAKGIGAVITAILFLIGQMALSWYLGTQSTKSVYGAAGSLVRQPGIPLWCGDDPLQARHCS